MVYNMGVGLGYEKLAITNIWTSIFDCDRGLVLVGNSTLEFF